MQSAQCRQYQVYNKCSKRLAFVMWKAQGKVTSSSPKWPPTWKRGKRRGKNKTRELLWKAGIMGVLSTFPYSSSSFLTRTIKLSPFAKGEKLCSESPNDTLVITQQRSCRTGLERVKWLRGTNPRNQYLSTNFTHFPTLHLLQLPVCSVSEFCFLDSAYK